MLRTAGRWRTEEEEEGRKGGGGGGSCCWLREARQVGHCTTGREGGREAHYLAGRSRCTCSPDKIRQAGKHPRLSPLYPSTSRGAGYSW